MTENNNIINDNKQDLDDIFSDVNLDDEPNDMSKPENKQATTNITHALVQTLKGITGLYASKTGIQSIALNDNDCLELEKALIPLNQELLKFVEILPYLPLILFALGYGGRIMAEWSDRKKSKKANAQIRPDKELEQ